MKKPKIMLVDDDPVILEELKALLEMCNYPVTPFTDPLEALNQFDHVECDVAFVDYTMPGMDGLSLVKALKEKKPEITSILCTGSLINHRIVSEMINSVNLNGFLTKPCRLKDIVGVLESSMEKTRLYKNMQKRKFPRSKISVPVYFFANNEEPGHTKRISIDTIDISTGGLSFLCKKDQGFDFSEKFEVDLSHLKPNQAKANAEVVWITKAENNTFRGGVRFL
ncbi:MAG: response regulator [Pseudomonadota bacterium]